MKKKNTILIVLLGLIAIGLLAVYILLRDDKPIGEEEKPAYFTIRTIATERIDRISLKTDRFDGIFYKNGEQWIHEESDVFPVNQSAINVILTVLASNLNAFEKVENPSSPSEYGFDTPTATLGLYSGNEELLLLYLGNKIPTQNRYYAMVQGDASVYIVSDNYYSYLAKERSEFLESVTMPSVSDTSLLREITITEGEEIRFHVCYDSQNPYDYSGVGLFGWTIYEPLNGFANADLNGDSWYGQMERYLHVSYNKLVAYRPTSYRTYGLDKPNSSITVRYADNYGREDYNYTIFFGNTTEDGSVYVKIDNMDWVFLMDAEMVSSWREVDVFAICYKTVFFPTAKSFNRITVTAGDKRWVLENTHADAEVAVYSLNGKVLEGDAFSNWSQALLSLKYSSLVTEENPGTEIMTIETDMADPTIRKNMKISFYEYSNSMYLVSINDKIDFTIDIRKVDAFIEYMKSMAQ